VRKHRRDGSLTVPLRNHQSSLPSRASGATLPARILHTNYGATGVAMPVLEECDVIRHLSVSRDKTPDSHRRATRHSATSPPKTETRLTDSNTRSFLDDFNLEHSFASASILHVSISASVDTAKSGKRSRLNTGDLGSPNCIYFG
jgi:hypothetical protein